MDDLVDWQSANAEYQATVQGFPYPLPEGATFPTDMAKTDSDTFQVGYGMGQAWFFWTCAQQDRFLQNFGVDDAEADAALDALEESASSQWRRDYVEDPDETFIKEVIGKSRLGDPSVLKEFYEADCVWYREVTG